MATLPPSILTILQEDFDLVRFRWDNAGFVADGWQEAGVNLDAAAMHESNAFAAFAGSDPAADAIGAVLSGLPNQATAVAQTKVAKYATELVASTPVRTALNGQMSEARGLINCSLTQLTDQGPACAPTAPTPPSVGGGGVPPGPPAPPPLGPRVRRADLLLPATVQTPAGSIEKEVQPIAEGAAATVNAAPPTPQPPVPPTPPKEVR